MYLCFLSQSFFLQVCLVARSVDKLDAVKKEIAEEGSMCVSFKCDVVDQEQVNFQTYL